MGSSPGRLLRFHANLTQGLSNEIQHRGLPAHESVFFKGFVASFGCLLCFARDPQRRDQRKRRGVFSHDVEP